MHFQSIKALILIKILILCFEKKLSVYINKISKYVGKEIYKTVIKEKCNWG